MKKWISIIIVLSMMFTLLACGAEPGDSSEPTQGVVEIIPGALPETSETTPVITPIEDEETTPIERPTEPAPEAEVEAFTPVRTVDGSDTARYDRFAAALLRNTLSDGNTLISPLSILAAFAMVGEGAEGETLRQLESATGMTMDEIRVLLQRCEDPTGENVTISNALWLNDTIPLEVRQEYVDTTAQWYRAELFRENFTPATVTEVNAWVKAHTKDRIDRILNELDPATKLLLINALTFDGSWATPYQSYQIDRQDFFPEGGQSHPVEMLYGSEKEYLETASATGFLKYYAGGRYAFAALLPKEGVSLTQLAEALCDQDELWAALENPTQIEVHTVLPKLDEEFAAELSPALQTMGLRDIFTPAADLTGIGGQPGELYVSFVKHKACLKLDENGTEAAAVTAIGVKFGATAKPQSFREVTLDHPFVYMIVDMEQQLPLFLGAIRDVESHVCEGLPLVDE